MLIRRLPLVLLLAVACTAKQEPEQAGPEKQAPQPAEERKTPPAASGPGYALIPDRAIGPVRVGMSKAEVEEEYRRRNEKIRAEYVFVDATPFESSSSATDGDVQARFDGNKED